MFRALVMSCVLLACSACDRELLESDRFVVLPELSGSLRIPLIATGEDGSRYQLSNATFEVSGTALLTLSTDARPEPALSTPLPAGTYTLFLRPGYQIRRMDHDRDDGPIEATLAAQNPAHFQLDQTEAVTQKLAFQHGDQLLTFGASPPVRVTLAP